MVPVASPNKSLLYPIKCFFICFLYVASCWGRPKSTNELSNRPDGQYKNISLGHVVKVYQCGDDAFFVKAIAPSACHTNECTIDVAVAGKSKDGSGYKNILTGQCGDHSLLIQSIGGRFDQKVTFGVADGVGQWGNIAGVYASALINNIASSSAGSALEMIQDGYHKTDKVATTTICVATIDQGYLTWANLGDSGLRVVRNGKFEVKTKEQQHTFNCPYQLGKGSINGPGDCDCAKCPLAKRDVVVMGTDGLFDNLDHAELINLINPDNAAEEIANKVVKRAIENSKDATKTSPFACKASAVGYAYTGGKIDDISIVVAVVR